MRNTETSAVKSRQKIAAENMTDAAKIHRKLTSGPIKSELRTPQQAVYTAVAFYAHALDAFREASLTAEGNFALHIAALTPDFAMLVTRRFVPGQGPRLVKELSDNCYLMAGLIFGIRDGQEWVTGARPFLNTPLVLEALKSRLEASEIGVN